MAKTHAKAVFSLNRKVVDVLEFGEEFYTKGSPVFMPSKPDEADQGKIPGIKGLAATYKQFEFDSRKRLVVVGHTDTGGDIKKNFELASARAEAVVCLLAGNVDRWAEISEKGQKVEDIKRILNHFHFNRKNWKCNPPDINDKWDGNNEQGILDATKKFFKAYNKTHRPRISMALVDGSIKTDKKWPKDVWKAVFRLYLEEMCTALSIKWKSYKKNPNIKKRIKSEIKFILDTKKSVGCGDSFPMTEPKFKSNYQQDKFRRVELLFFNGKDINQKTNRIGSRVFACMVGGTTKHTSAGPPKCPLWYNNHLYASYIDPEKDLKAVAYHMAFTYIDQVKVKDKKPTVQKVPAGLKIEAYFYKKVGKTKQKKPVRSVIKFSDGVYTVKVEGAPKRNNIHFEFDTKLPSAPDKSKWVFTSDSNAAPKITAKVNNEVKALRAPDKYADYIKYYDLPKEWSSEMYWTRYKSRGKDKGGRFKTVMKNLKLKPYGKKKTKADNPLTFSLDDIVLIDSKGRQNINDPKNRTPKDKKKSNALTSLSGYSRVSLFHVTGEEFLLYKPMTNYPALTDFKFKRNLITDLPVDGVARLVIFANDFYSVSGKRTEINPKFKAGKHVLGCRAAVLGDPEHHFGTRVRAEIFAKGQTITLANGSQTVTGNKTKFLSELSPGLQLSIWIGPKWSTRKYTIASIKNDTELTLTAAPHNTEVGAGKEFKTFSPPHHCVDCGNFQLHYIHEGCVISDPAKAGGLKVRSFLLIYWNGRYKRSGSSVANAQLKTFAREGPKNTKERWEDKGYTIEPQTVDANNKGKLQIKPVFHFETKYPNNGGKHGCMVTITNDSNDGQMSVTSSKMYKKSYKVPATNAASEYKRGEETDVDGKKYKELIIAHEYGHGTGKDDDYAYEDGEQYDATDNFFHQYYPGMPYNWDQTSMMNLTAAPRMRQVWNFVNRLNEAASDNKELKGLLGGTSYKMVHRFNKGGTDKTFNFFLASTPNDYRDTCKPANTGTTAFVAGKAAKALIPAIPIGQPGGPKPEVPARAGVQGKGKLALALYKLGEDETAWSIKISGVPNDVHTGKPFDGILAVSINVGVKFKSYKEKTGPTTYTTNNCSSAFKKAWMADLRSRIKKELSGRYYLEGTNADFKKTYIYFFPVVLDLKALATASKPEDFGKAHYVVTVRISNNTIVPEPGPATELEVGNYSSRKWIARYMFGQDATWTGAAVPFHSRDESQPGVNRKVKNVVDAPFKLADLNFIRDWLRTELGDNSFVLKGTPKP
ncbi:MAG: hypothetical protein KOO63_11060 [Bacteroidales bacterium]|nr:hypothetical protein [Candidatus Latescibacterota bacterium]